MHTRELMQSTLVFHTYSNNAIKPFDAAHFPISYKEPETTAEFEIIDLAQENVFSGATAEILHRITRLYTLEANSPGSSFTSDTQLEQEIPPGLTEFPNLALTTCI